LCRYIQMRMIGLYVDVKHIHTHTHKHTHAHTHTHTHTHTHCLSFPLTQVKSHTDRLVYINTYNKNVHTHTHPRTFDTEMNHIHSSRVMNPSFAPFTQTIHTSAHRHADST